MVRTKNSIRHQVREEAARILAQENRAMHISELGAKVLVALDAEGEISIKRINDALHEDPLRRFLRVERATWQLR